MPHKQALLQLVDEVDEEAASYGAINTVKCDEDCRLIGYNTDVRGLFMALERNDAKLDGAHIMVIGAAGSDFDDFSFLDDTRALICDLIYNPWETSLLRYAKQQGLKTMNGIDMLIYQGLLAFEIFMDVKLDCDAEHDRLLPLCREHISVL